MLLAQSTNTKIALIFFLSLKADVSYFQPGNFIKNIAILKRNQKRSLCYKNQGCMLQMK